MEGERVGAIRDGMERTDGRLIGVGYENALMDLRL